jgi:tetratricopeptide (TPR) repeat protein
MLFAKWNLLLCLVLLGLTILAGCGGLTEKQPGDPSNADPGKDRKIKETAAVSVNQAQYVKLSVQAKNNFTAAILAIKNGENNAAENLLKKVTKEYPRFYSAPVNLGIVYYKTGRLSEAEGVLKSVVKADTRNLVAYNYLGIVYRKEGKFKEAENAYKAALQISPDYANAHLNLGILYDLYFQNTKKALESYQHYQVVVTKQKGEEDKEVKKWIFDLKGRKK